MKRPAQNDRNPKRFKIDNSETISNQTKESEKVEKSVRKIAVVHPYIIRERSVQAQTIQNYYRYQNFYMYQNYYMYQNTYNNFARSQSIPQNYDSDSDYDDTWM